ncbi:hypothetical protein B808_1069 [Fructilactobacillus florum 8D]|uniref:Integral membrane protein n=1 Tax=Fructilactobacillus florum 8D TaxID=1221538 RepID=W9EFE0_9LACO|nr:DUF3397 family protein [Fructilactobacillus florum]EKK20326.1 hypothetical protein B807_965 [Fructilactobacillus florum 2F]ETO39961.1 hypothetical protein B808_1069 [Fructilactobacillus florum 8D]
MGTVKIPTTIIALLQQQLWPLVLFAGGGLLLSIWRRLPFSPQLKRLRVLDFWIFPASWLVHVTTLQATGASLLPILFCGWFVIGLAWLSWLWFVDGEVVMTRFWFLFWRFGDLYWLFWYFICLGGALLIRIK